MNAVEYLQEKTKNGTLMKWALVGMVIVALWFIVTAALLTRQSAASERASKTMERWVTGMDAHVAAQYARTVSTTLSEGPYATTIGDRIRCPGDEVRVIHEQRQLFKEIK